jgi:hypothetical protein
MENNGKKYLKRVQLEQLLSVARMMVNMEQITLDLFHVKKRDPANNQKSFVCLDVWMSDDMCGTYGCLGGYYERTFREELKGGYKSIAEHFDITLQECKEIFGPDRKLYERVSTIKRVLNKVPSYTLKVA